MEIFCPKNKVVVIHDKTFYFPAFLVPALCLVMIHFAGCNKPLVVALLCMTVGINGMQFNSVNVNHIDIGSNFAGTLMGITNMTANMAGFLAPMAISYIIEGHVSNFSGKHYHKQSENIYAWLNWAL